MFAGPAHGIKNYLFVQVKTFSLVGIGVTPTSVNYNNIRLTIVLFFGVFTCCYWITCYNIHNIHDLPSVTSNLVMLVQGFLTFSKFFVFFLHREKLIKYVQIIDGSIRKLSKEEMAIIIEENRRDFKLGASYYFAAAASGSFCFLSMILGYIVPLIMRKPPKRVLTIKGCGYGHDLSTDIGFGFALILCALSLHFMLNVSVGFDSLFSWFVHNIAGRFRILNKKLEKLYTMPYSMNNMMRRVIDCIQLHEENLEIINAINNIYGFLILLQCGVLSLEICLSCYAILQSETILDALAYISLLFAILCQLIIYCYCGQRIENESEATSLAFYNNINWDWWPIQYRKLFILSIMRSKKTCALTALIFTVNYPLLLNIVRGAASYITMLQSFAENQ